MSTEINTPQYSIYPRTIPAFDQTRIDATGDFFYVKESEQPLLYQMDEGPDLPWDVGTGPAKAQFSRLTIKNPWSSPVRVLVYAGRGGVIDNRFTLVPSRDFAIPVYESKTEVAGWNANTIAATTAIAFPGTPILPRVKRKSLVVSNLDVANPLYIKSGVTGGYLTGNYCAAVFFGTTVILPISGPVWVVNETAAPIPCCISEIWVVK